MQSIFISEGQRKETHCILDTMAVWSTVTCAPQCKGVPALVPVFGIMKTTLSIYTYRLHLGAQWSGIHRPRQLRSKVST